MDAFSAKCCVRHTLKKFDDEEECRYTSAAHADSLMPLRRNHLNPAFFNVEAKLPFELRLKDFDMAMQDVYDFFYDVNRGLVGRGLLRLDDMLRPAIMSGLLSGLDLVGRKEWKSRPRANQAEPSIRMEPVNNGCAFSCMR